MRQQQRTGKSGRSTARAVMALLAVSLSAGLCACAGSRPDGPYTPISEAMRDTAAAQRLNHEAAPLISTDPARAEALLRRALNADLYYGPAHNNLGVLFLQQGRLYEAAGEFEWARKLMPGNPDPRMNLALVLERAGRTDDALSAYAAALEVRPEHIQSIQALARLQLRFGRADERTAGLLDEIAVRGETERWRDWARGQRIRLAAKERP